MSGQELRALEKVLDIVCAARKHQWPIDPVIPVPPPAPVGPTPPPPAPTPAVAPGIPQDPYYYDQAGDIVKSCGGAKSGYCYNSDGIRCSQGSVPVKRCAGVTGTTTACVNMSNQFSTPPPFGCFSKTQYLGLAGSSADDEQQPPMY